MKKKRVYISGAVSDLPISEVKSNFDRAKRFISELAGGLFEPISPFDIYLGSSASWLEYMLVCLPMLAVCDCIYMQKNWKTSKGARIEYALAVGAGLEVMFEN